MPTHPRLTILLLAAILAALAIALLSQYWGGLLPCTLCYWQRWAYGAAFLWLAPGLLPIWSGRQQAIILASGSAALFTVAGIAFFHAGVEQGWWQGLSSCSAGDLSGSVDDILAQIEAAPVVRCDEIPWALFGISMAGWNFLYALCLAGIAAAGALKSWKGRDQ